MDICHVQAEADMRTEQSKVLASAKRTTDLDGKRQEFKIRYAKVHCHCMHARALDWFEHGEAAVKWLTWGPVVSVDAWREPLCVDKFLIIGFPIFLPIHTAAQNPLYQTPAHKQGLARAGQVTLESPARSTISQVHICLSVQPLIKPRALIGKVSEQRVITITHL